MHRVRIPHPFVRTEIASVFRTTEGPKRFWCVADLVAPQCGSTGPTDEIRFKWLADIFIESSGEFDLPLPMDCDGS